LKTKPFRWILFICLINLLFIITPSKCLGDNSKYFPIQSVKRNMEGVGKSVFYGTKIENFNVEVVDVVIGKNIAQSYIVVKVTDEKLKKMGGISAGMSGSPIFFDGKIAGALAYSWETKDNLIGVVTPIETMLKLWENLPDMPTMKALPSSVIFTIGLGERAGKKLQEKENLFSRKIISLPKILFSQRQSDQGIELQPGSAVGVQLIRGDVDVVSLGTLTWREGNKIIAFGHPFLHQGKVNYFLSSMYVNFSLEGKDFPFKVGTPIEPVGIIDEDRSAGIAGRLGVMPEVIKASIEIGNEKSSLAKYEFDIIRNENVVVEFFPEIILDSIDQALDSQRPGSARVFLVIDGSQFHFLNEFFWVSKNDIASYISNNLTKILEDIFKNPFQPIDAEKIEIKVVYLPDVREATFKNLYLPVDVKRGSDLKGKIDLNLHRQGMKSLDFDILIPKDFVPGEADVIARGLSWGAESSQSPSPSPTDLDIYIDEKVKQLKSNGVVIEIRSKAESFPSSTQKNYFSQAISLPFVLEGSFTGSVVVLE